ncbi:hypothetical protein CLOACE_02000 [Clostridium acetireducens DSM 10703]|uniref:Transcription antitermination protein NusB n=1 Tax=Clostridium acetireducens DSM 10703 TaxID=1121290 RepID=A0A1E8F1T5_9CLOT|nr:transcription antitermination factor NusB [Clostridium acetireducens]OFI07596.1 hypothetical protein CLOACE_02000 [Clostridium acetireducens DSM 10703]
MNRRKSREIAMQLLFETTIKGDSFIDVIQNLKENIDIDLENKIKDEEGINLNDVDMEYILKILKGVFENLEYIDNVLKPYLKNWKIDRLSKVDLSIMRLCTYEILFEDSIPDKVSINEAIELAKKFAGDKTPAFINGVLNNVLNNKENINKNN